MDVSGRGVPVDFATADTNTDTNTTATLVSVAGALDAACEPPPVATTVTHNTESSELADEHELACRSGSHASLPPTSTATSPLTQLPPELLDHVLQLVPARERQRAALALTHAVPGFEPALRTLWTHLAVSRYQQIWPLWRKLKEEKRGAAAVRTFAMESWHGDVDILNNVLRCLPELHTLLLNLGTNFAPEQLAEVFERVRPDLRRMEMCFRPYVEQATYYQFLKGSYFDTAIETLLQTWPESPNFTHLSIVQDVPPRKTAPPKREHSSVSSLANSLTDLRLVGVDTPGVSNVASRVASTTASTVGNTAAATPIGSDSEDSDDDSDTPPTSLDSRDPDEPKSEWDLRRAPFQYLSERLQYCKPKRFAQPIVFFDINCISRFGSSPVAKHLTHLRLRVPSRDIAYVLVAPPRNGEAREPLFPSLRYLDLSTTNVRLDAVLATLLRNYNRLEHLVLDRVNLFGFSARDRGNGLCRELGGMCVSAGLARGKERERAIATWDLAQRTAIARAEAEQRRAHATSVPDAALTPEQRAAREDEARRDEMQRQIALARSRRGHRSAGHSTISLRDRPNRRTETAAVNPADIPAPDRAYFVLPPLPTLRTLCIGGEAPLLASFRPATWEDEFHSGWRDGLAKLSGWAAHVADRYERALKRADEWTEWHARQAAADKSVKKGKGKKAETADKPRPPLDIRLFRFPTSDEDVAPSNAADPTAGLVEVYPEHPRDYLNNYKQAAADAELYTHSQAVRPPCVLCTVPDCEGPRRRAEDGLGIDGRGGMDKPHRPGCGHYVGRETWGWDSVI